MKIALFGYGRMGTLIESIAKTQGHEVLPPIIHDTDDATRRLILSDCDVAIDFSLGSAVPQNVKDCLLMKKPIVIGATGWDDKKRAIFQEVEAAAGCLLHASNYSIGVNMLFQLNSLLASWMQKFDTYKPTISETHHTAKIDAPSGTAITLAQGILNEYKGLSAWSLMDTSNQPAGILPIVAHRKGDVKGYHEVSWTSQVDTIKLSHDAHSRDGFAQGALLGAEFVIGRTGIFTAQDLFNFTP